VIKSGLKSHKDCCLWLCWYSDFVR